MLRKVKSWLEDALVKMIIRKVIKRIEKMKGSWKTTVLGLLAALGVLFQQVAAAIDGDPATVFSLEVAIGAIVTALALFGLGQQSRQKDVSSEQELAARNK